MYWGVVTEIAQNSISVKVDLPGEQPRRFTLSETLAAGKVPTTGRPIPGRTRPYEPSAGEMYRITDVRVGDWVTVLHSSVDGVVTCDHICIQKRPGGRVPPIPEEADAIVRPPFEPDPAFQRHYIPYHEWVNAYWDLEERGIAYPEHFGRHRRFPVAPPPRPVNRAP